MTSDTLSFAIQLYSEKRFNEALHAFRQLSGDDADYGQAICLYSMQRYSEARETVERCLASNPGRADAIELRRILEQMGVGEPSVPPAGSSSVPAPASSVRTSTSDPSASQGSAPQPPPLSVEDLVNPSTCLSAGQGRPFAGQSTYTGEAALDAAIAAARECMPETETAYKPSGKTTTSASLTMLAVTPLALLVMLIVCGGLAFGFALLTGDISADTRGERRGLGLASLVVDFALVFLMFRLPSTLYALIGKWLKNRNPTLPSVLAGFITFIVAIVLFFPIWGGATLAPTDLTFLFIPVRWVLIILGGLIVPLLVALMTYGKIASQKFCEVKGVFLRPMKTVQIEFDFAENALALLRQGAFDAVSRLPAPKEPKSRHCAKVTLWWNELAETAFVEMQVLFRGKSKPQKKMTLEESKDKASDWLVFSARLDRSQAQALFAAWPG